MATLSQKHITQFQHFILNFYYLHGRHNLPWRQTTDPYHILVSELMLQQTQVERVIPKFNNFLKHFPTVGQLSEASLADILQQWQGLGYNRRAKFLHNTAQAVVSQYSGIFPKSEEELRSLPGIGPYTASAICTFAYNQPTIVIETNIRTVFLHHFFPNKTEVSDTELLPLIQSSLETSQPRNWYSALMDYGTQLKKVISNPSRKSKHHTTQSKFKGSKREVRGSIISQLSHHNGLTLQSLKSNLSGEKNYFTNVLHDLINEKMLMKDGNMYYLYDETKKV